MKKNQTFDKFQSKLTVEAVLNSLLMGLSTGFLVGGLVALICWLCGYKDGVWVALGLGIGAFAIASLLFYFLKFRPSLHETGRRVDTLGLQERAVTMLEYIDDKSYMASRQREDATSRIVSTSAKALKATVPVWIGIVTACAITFGMPFGVVSALYTADKLDSPTNPYDPMANFIAVDYFAEEGGEIEGNPNQLLENPGDDAETVTAVAIDGYVFMGWDDGIKSPTRTDLNVQEAFEVTAMFEAIGDNEGEEGDFDGPGNKGDSASDQPTDGESSGSEGDEGDGSGNKGDSEGTGSGDDKGEGKGDGQGDGAGGKWSEKNQIIDGESYYREWLDQYYADAMDQLASLEDLPPEIRAFIEAYYESV